MLIHSNSMVTGENGINEALKVFFQSSPDVMVIIEPDGTILDANPPFIEMFACYHSQVIGVNFYQLIHSQPLLQHLLSRRKEIAQEAVCNGQIITFEDVQENTINRITIYPVLISDGKVNNLLIVKQDITPQRKKNQPVFTPENYHLGVWSIDLKTNESFCSPRNAHIFGYDTPPAVWNLKTILEHVIPEDRSKLLQFYQEGVKNLTGWNIEYRICRFSDNKTRWLLDIGRREHDEKGKIVHLSGITSDITELKEAEQKLADLEQHLDVTSQSCRLGLWKVKLSTMDLTTNAEFDRIHGFSLNNITLTDELVRNLVVPEDYDRLIAFIENCVTNHVDGELEYRIRRQDGLIRWLSLIAKIQYNLAGEASNIIGVTRDITAQKEKDKKAEDLQIQWDVTANQCNIGMWRVDLETGQVIRGVEHARLFGENPYNLDWSVNKFLDHVVPEDRQMAAELYNESLVNYKDVNFDCRIRRKDGQLRWINVIGSFQFDEHNKATCVVGTTTDITEKKILEIEREELQQQLQQSQKMELIGQLAGGIAHDFNNLLAAIQGNTEHILSEISSTNPHFQNLNSILNSVSRSTEMVRQLLAFARKQSVCLKNIELDAELDDMYLMLRKLIKANITLLWKLNCPETFANIDPSNCFASDGNGESALLS